MNEFERVQIPKEKKGYVGSIFMALFVLFLIFLVTYLYLISKDDQERVRQATFEILNQSDNASGVNSAEFGGE